MRAKSLFPIFVVLLLASTSYTQFTPNLISHFEFGGIDDYQDSVASTTGTAEGNAHIIWDDARKSYVLNPDGDGSYVDTSVAWRDIVDTAITLAAWIKTDSLTDLDTVVSLGYAWRLYADSSLNMAFECGNTQPSSRVIGSQNVNDGIWHHLVGTYDGSQSRLYVDGQLDGSVDASGSIESLGDTYFGCIGALYKRNDGAARNFFNGLIDDVRIYDRALSAEEVSDMVIVPEVSQPTPADGQTDVVQDVILGWTPGEYAVKHNVYFGTSLDDLSTASVNNPMEVLVSEGQDVNSYDPEGVLPFGQTYYWRVDEVSAPPDNTIFEGPVWSFTVEPYSIPAEMVIATASSQDPRYPPENTINGSGLDEADLHGTAATTMWLSAVGDPATWIQYAFDRTYKLDKMLVWNSNQAVESFVGFGIKEVTIEVSTNGTDWTVLENVPQFAQAPGTPDYAHNTTVDFGDLTAKYVKLTANSNWGGVFNQYGLSEVRFFHVPLHAREPNPDSGATDVDLDPVLSFRAGREAAEHDVYLGT
ncbi:MAG: LamG-like jellyroll fold domain-containing protein, partial [Planctomycetota bacterium]